MKAGDLKRIITIQRPKYSTDVKGRRLTQWETVATCRASKTDVSARDFYAAHSAHALDISTFGIRWRDDIDKECRILHMGEIYQIEQINHLGYKRDFMHIKARKILGEGV